MNSPKSFLKRGGNTFQLMRPKLPWYQNQEKRTQENYRPIALVNIDTGILIRISANRVQQSVKHCKTSQPNAVCLRNAKLVRHLRKSVIIIFHINKFEKKTYMARCIGAEKKTFLNTQHPPRIKTLSKLSGIEGIFRTQMKGIHKIEKGKKTTSNIIFNREKNAAFILRLRTRKGCHSHNSCSASHRNFYPRQ